MNKVDFNCFVGGWPFHKVKRNNFESLINLHRVNGITQGFISSTDAVFYNDPFEADRELEEIIKENSNYHHVITVNPTLPGTINSIERAVRELNVAGVRILPGIHNYSLADNSIVELMEILNKHGLPLFLTLHLEDERQEYLLHSRKIPEAELTEFLSIYLSVPTLLCNIKFVELTAIKQTVLSRNNVFADFSGMNIGFFLMKKLINEGLVGRMVYGSLAPIFCLKSTILVAEELGLDNDITKAVMTGESFLRAIGKNNSVLIEKA